MIVKERSTQRRWKYKNLTPEQREQHLARCRVYRQNNKAKVSKASRQKWLRTYGLTEDTYAAMFSSQAGVCFICKQPDNRRLCIDHNHSTGKVRKLLCTKCNAGLGNFKENLSIMESAMQYLRDHQSS